MPKLFGSAIIQNLENAKFCSCQINLVTVFQRVHVHFKLMPINCFLRHISTEYCFPMNCHL